MRSWSRRGILAVTMTVIFLAKMLSVSPVMVQGTSPPEGALNGEPGIDWLDAGDTTKPTIDWSKALVESTMRRYPTAKDLGSWGYAKSPYLYGQYLVWRRTGTASISNTLKIG